MSDAAYYRAEAFRFMDWAQSSTDPIVQRRWRRLADEYITLAEQVDAKETGRPPLLRLPLTSMRASRRQPVQQKQGKLGTEEAAEC